jgi:hypothetical protein
MFLQLMSFERNLFNTLHRLLKFLCWFPVSFVARLLGSNTWLFTLSQETDGFRDKIVQFIGRFGRQLKPAVRKAI